MDTAILAAQAKKILNRYQNDTGTKLYSKAREFLRVHAGEKSTFFTMLDEIQNRDIYESEKVKAVYDQVEAFVEYIESGLHRGSSLEYKVKTEMTLDFLDRAKAMLKKDKNHPAGAAVLIGSVLEEFLKNWIIEAGLKRIPGKETIPGCVQILKKAQLVTRQDIADILNWNVMYNYALRGEWEEINDKKRITIMHEGVVLLLRKYSPG